MSEKLGFQKYTQAVCGYEKLSSWAEILETGEKCKTSVLIHLLMADYWVAHGDFVKAGACVQEASKMEPIDKTEVLYQKGFESFILKGDFAKAAKHFGDIFWNDPHDLFALKRAQLMSFLCGDVKSMLAVAQPKENDFLRKLPFYHGMLAFALEENDELKAAEDVCEEGMKLFPNDPWLHHCMAHIFYFQGRIDEGVRRLSKLSRHWDDLMVFMRCHLWWHIGLLYLERQENARAMELVKQKCWDNSGDKSNVEVHIGILGFLWKFELYTNKSQRELYEEVLSVINQEDKSPGYFLFDVLYLRALLRTGNSNKAEKFSEKMGVTITKSYACGLMELTKRDSKGLDLLEEGLEKAPQFMGSIEQRLVLHEHYARECIRLGENERAKKCIKGLLNKRNSEVWRSWLDTDLPDEKIKD